MTSLPFVIAEAAQGFEGDEKLAVLLAKAAAASGANAIKFQLVIASELATPDYEHYQLFKSLEMSAQKWASVKKICDDNAIELQFDIFGENSLQIAESLNVQTVKVHPTDINNTAFLSKLKSSKMKNVILGVGGAYLNEIESAVTLLSLKKIILMTGFQGYPTRGNENQVGRIKQLKEKFTHQSIGFADHHPDLEHSSLVSLLAICAGASFVEKHITLARNLKLEDHEAALNPDEFENYTIVVKQSETIWGKVKDQDDFGMSQTEKKYRMAIRRDVVANRLIEKGELITSKDVTLKRTGTSNAIKQLQIALNKVAKKDLEEGTALVEEHLSS